MLWNKMLNSLIETIEFKITINAILIWLSFSLIASYQWTKEFGIFSKRRTTENAFDST